MSLRRTWAVFRLELAHTLRRPLFWILVLLLLLTAWGLSTGNVRIASGDSQVGGTKAWITSQFAVSQLMAVIVFLYYGFFVAIAAGMIVIRDEEQRIGELLFSSPLTTAEYAWGKFLAVLAAFGLALLAQCGFHAFFNHALADAESAEFVGPFAITNYLKPALLFGVPTIVFFGGTSFAVGALTRRPILVFALPVATLLVCGFFLWDWSPAWLDPGWNRVLMALDPAGFRWLNETWLKVDRGVEFYNHAPIGLDAELVASRLGWLAFGSIAVFVAERRLRSTLRGRRSTRARRRDLTSTEGERSVRIELERSPLATLGMTSRAPGFVRGLVEVARVELRELKSHPGLYLFVPLILLETISVALFADTGVFDTPRLATSGTLATGSADTLTLLVTLLLAFYTVESLERERGRGLSSIYYATPVRTASILFGKVLANGLVGVVILLAALLADVVILLVQGRFALEPWPFVLVWGALLLPTLLAWCAFIAAVFSLTGNRYTTYALALGAWLATGYFSVQGDMNWVGNWALWDALRWSDLGAFEIDARALFWNRVFYLGLGVFFTALAVRFFPRTSRDPAATLVRLRPAKLFRSALHLGRWAIVPAAAGLILLQTVRAGYEGEALKKKAKDYWRRNVATFTDAVVPAITEVDIALDLEPEKRWFKTQGSYRLLNDRAQPLRELPVTPGFHFEDIHWRIDGQEAPMENRAGLVVFELDPPLAPGASIELSFEHEGTFPDGASENGGGASEFILKGGVVLTSFSPTFVPVIGYLDSIGVDEDNQYDAKVYPDDFYVGTTDSGLGNNTAFTTRIAVRAPAEYTVNSVGTLVSEEQDGAYKRVVWKSDHPVHFFNVVAGRWAVKKGAGTAIHYHPAHAVNIDEMLLALDGARRWYSEWFRPFPWQELKLSEFPAHATYAQGFPTNITFSESIGFLTESKPEAQAAFFVTAHEAAHQWWGNILVPGKGPGGNILSEGTSHFATILLMEQVLGLRERIEFCKQIEDDYAERRQVDSEKALVWIDGSRAGDETVTYNKGGWVFWMLLNRIGRENALRGCQEFIRRFEKGPDHPVLQDFVETLREFAPDAASYEEFVQQWFFEVAVPQYELSGAERVRAPAENGGTEAWEVRVRVKNAGTGTMPVEIAAARGERFPDVEEEERAEPGEDIVEAAEPKGAEEPANPYRDARTTLVLGPGEEEAVVLRCDFEPERVLVDPDALVLQLERKAAIVRF